MLLCPSRKVPGFGCDTRAYRVTMPLEVELEMEKKKGEDALGEFLEPEQKER
jgi:hypothetical protein